MKVVERCGIRGAPLLPVQFHDLLERHGALRGAPRALLSQHLLEPAAAGLRAW